MRSSILQIGNRLSLQAFYIVFFKSMEIYIFLEDRQNAQDWKKIEIMLLSKKMNIMNSILDFIRCKQFSWYGQVQRIIEENLPQTILEWCPIGRRRKGSSRNSYL